MGIWLGRYEFKGPFVDPEALDDTPGIYAVLSCRNNEYELVELGEADRLKTALCGQDSPRLAAAGGLRVAAVRYEPRATSGRRKELVWQILREFNGQCQVRN